MRASCNPAFGVAWSPGAASIAGMAIFGSVSTVRSQLATVRRFDSAFEYVGNLLASEVARASVLRLAAGKTERIELGGGAFALEQAYFSKLRPDGFFEAHRKYIDVQVILEGEEWMEVADAAAMEVRAAYDTDRDLVVYADGRASRLLLRAGDAAVFHPADVHMPGLCGAAGPTLVRKTVVKVPVEDAASGRDAQAR